MKKMSWVLVLALALIPLWNAQAQKVQLPKGKKAAIVLTYDDGLHSQLEHVVPVLDKYKMKGTFFLWAGMVQQEDIPAWRKVNKKGHELGNHSIYHPCNAGIDPDTASGKCGSLECYTIKEMLEEIRVMNLFLKAIDGKDIHSYAYPCSQTSAGDGDFSNPMIDSGMINYARTDDGGGVISDLKNFNPALVSSFAAHKDYKLEDFLPYINKVREAEGVGVIIFHGIGADWLTVSDEEHLRLIQYLAKQRDIWVAPFSTVLDYISKNSK